jgi:hypothetical protein
MVYKITITTFPAAILQRHFELVLDFPEEKLTDYISKFFKSVNLGPWKVHHATIENQENGSKYQAFSDHAAIMYKRRGQIVQYSFNNIQVNKRKLRLKEPYNLTIYTDAEVDSKRIRKSVKTY